MRHSQYASGYLLRAREGTLYARPFDPGRLQVEGEETAIASPVGAAAYGSGFGRFSVSQSGTLAYFSGSSLDGDMQLAWVDRNGAKVTALGSRAYGQIALSPKDRSAAFEIRVAEDEYDLWAMELDRGVSSRVTVTAGRERDPVWAPDGRSLVFTVRQADGDADLWRKGLKASDPKTVVANSEDEDIPESWSRDGKTLLVVRRSADDMQSVWAVPIDRQGEAEPVLNTGFRVDEPQLSPDGRWLAYVSPESGIEEVYVEPYRRDGLRVKVSVAGGGQPKWRSDGSELFYTTLTRAPRLVVVAVREESGSLRVGLPTDLFEVQGFEGPGYDDYAVSEDGQRFLVKLPIEEKLQTQLHIVTNWPSLLE